MQHMFAAQLCTDYRLNSKVMRFVLWFLLIFSASEASSEETSLSNETSEPQSSVFALADAIYDKQKECDAIVGEAVVKALEKGITKQFPVPDERYMQCRKTLDEKKKMYITTALIGLNYYSKLFPMVLSNKQFVTLPVPADESLSTAAGPEFDIQQELCMTNKLCLTLVRLKFSKYDAEDVIEQKESVSRCLKFLNELKLKYIDVKKKYGKVFEMGQGLPVVCIDGEVTLSLPEIEIDEAHKTNSPSTASGIPKIKSDVGNDVNSDDSTTNKLDSKNPYRDIYNEVVKEIKSINEEKSKNEEIADQRSGNEDPNSDLEDNEHPAIEEAGKDKSMTNDKTDTQEEVLSNLKTNEFTTENKDISDHPVNEVSLSDSKPDDGVVRSETSEDVDPSQEEDKLNPSKSEDIQEIAMRKPSEDESPSQEKETSSTKKPEDTSERNQNTKSETSENIPVLVETKTPSNKDDEITNERAGSTKESKKKGPQKPKDNDNMELVSYRVRVVTKNSDGKVVKIQASGQIKKTESGNLSPNQPSSNIDPRSDGGAERKSDLGPVSTPTEVNETEERKHPVSLEDNIILMENDCKELLNFGEQLMQHKMLSSLVHLENHYNECIKRLDTLKKRYIEKHQLDIMSHKNFFSLILPSGDPKLVSLPTQFLKTDLVEKQSSSDLTSDDVFELEDFFREKGRSEHPTLNQREPFDDPAFISNDEFLESLHAPSDTSTLSKVASMLHMNGGHTDKKIAE